MAFKNIHTLMQSKGTLEMDMEDIMKTAYKHLPHLVNITLATVNFQDLSQCYGVQFRLG